MVSRWVLRQRYRKVIREVLTRSIARGIIWIARPALRATRVLLRPRQLHGRASIVNLFRPSRSRPQWVARCIEQRAGANPLCPRWVCAVQRRRFPVGASPTRQSLQPEAIGAVMEVTKWLQP